MVDRGAIYNQLMDTEMINKKSVLTVLSIVALSLVMQFGFHRMVDAQAPAKYYKEHIATQFNNGRRLEILKITDVSLKTVCYVSSREYSDNSYAISCVKQ
jgi:hypothetical protein